jgi:hypothetical protein
VVRIDAQAATIWIRQGDAEVPIATSGVGPDLVRYTATPA